MSEISATPNYSPPADLDRWRRYALIAAVVGIALSALGALSDLEQFSRSYLVSWIYWLSIAMGSFGVLMLHHLTRGGWGLMIRRILEAASRTLPVLVVLFLPIALRLSDIFVWARPEAADDPLIALKTWFLNEPFFLIRAAAYFAIWGAFVIALNRLSLKQDQTGDLGLFRRMQVWAGPGMVIYAITASLASIDWLMSLDPHWYSSLFPIYFMGGQIVAAMAFTIVIVRYLSSRKPMSSVLSSQHYHDYGNLQMAFVLLWSYFALSQFLIIWSGNLAEETVWYLERQDGPWKWVSLSLVMFHFSVPFFFLLSRRIKRDIDLLVRIACLLLIMRWVDLYWLAAPAFSHGHFSPHWLDFGTLLAIGGVWTVAFIQQLKKRPLLPIQDPYLEEALDADQPLDSELGLRGIVGVGVVLIVVTVAATALMWWMSLALKSQMAADDPAPSALPEARSQQRPQGPLLQSDPIGDMQRMRQEESAVLEHAEWIDQSTRTARLPIDTALDIIAARGELPDLSSQQHLVEDVP